MSKEALFSKARIYVLINDQSKPLALSRLVFSMEQLQSLYTIQACGDTRFCPPLEQWYYFVLQSRDYDLIPILSDNRVINLYSLPQEMQVTVRLRSAIETLKYAARSTESIINLRGALWWWLYQPLKTKVPQPIFNIYKRFRNSYKTAYTIAYELDQIKYPLFPWQMCLPLFLLVVRYFLSRSSKISGQELKVKRDKWLAPAPTDLLFYLTPPDWPLQEWSNVFQKITQVIRIIKSKYNVDAVTRKKSYGKKRNDTGIMISTLEEAPVALGTLVETHKKEFRNNTEWISLLEESPKLYEICGLIIYYYLLRTLNSRIQHYVSPSECPVYLKFRGNFTSQPKKQKK